MSRKWLFILFGSAFGLTVIAIPAAIMSQSGSLEEEIWNQDIPELVSAVEIKEKYKNTNCLKDYFGSVNWNNTTTTKTGKPNFPSFASSSAESCLSVTYQKQKYIGGKWTGRFKLVWSFTDGNNGLITTIKAKTKEEKLKLSAVAYLVSKKDDLWTITSSKENKEEAVAEDYKDLFNKIPQAGEIEENEKFKFFWGFESDLKKICKSDECENLKATRTTTSATWIFSKESTSSKSNITSWSSALSSWLENTFGWNDLHKKLESIKGEWKLKIASNFSE